jgi:hypothetical protein
LIEKFATFAIYPRFPNISKQPKSIQPSNPIYIFQQYVIIYYNYSFIIKYLMLFIKSSSSFIRNYLQFKSVPSIYLQSNHLLHH